MSKRRVKEHVKISHTYCMMSGMIIVLIFTALSYIGLTYKCDRVNREILILEQEKEGYQKRFSDEQAKWAKLKTCENVKRRLAREGIHLQSIASEQIVRLNIKPIFSTKYAMVKDDR
jgi:hypothetical protein